jgi:hypothetical protein
MDIFDIFDQFTTGLANNPVSDVATKMYKKWEDKVGEWDYMYADNELTTDSASIVDDFDIYEDREKMMLRRMMVVTAKDQFRVSSLVKQGSMLMKLRTQLNTKWRHFKKNNQ